MSEPMRANVEIIVRNGCSERWIFPVGNGRELFDRVFIAVIDAERAGREVVCININTPPPQPAPKINAEPRRFFSA